VFDQLTEYVSGSNWTYLFILAVAALDVIIPLVPSETSVILAGVLAASGDLQIGLVIVAASAGAIIGDNIAYWIGRRAGKWFERKRGRPEWAEHQLKERGPYLLVVGRFIPGGRTAVTIAAGMLHMRYTKFLLWDSLAGVIWGTYAAMLGYIGGIAFEREPWKGFLVAFAVAVGLAVVVEIVRWYRKRRTAATA
jgi:membrane protein DedA with SNARE-associated domain